MILWFDLSYTGTTGYAVIDKDGKVIKYGGFNLHDNSSCGGRLTLLESKVNVLIRETAPEVIGVEDIFCQSTTGYKKLAKIQGIVERVAFHHNKPVEFIMASEIRRYFNLNISKILTEAEYNKHCAGCLKKNKNYIVRPYAAYRDNPDNYLNQFKDIDFSEYANYVTYNDSIYHIVRDAAILNKPLKAKKKNDPPRYKKVGSPITEFEYAKKIVVIDYLNKHYNLNFSFADNDVADAVLGGLRLHAKIYLKK